ncbi:MAG TPA: PAS domain S-box protein [Desulfuromonadales bacterium]|nr:PAS domain S-box protein [Desulfuromonadales bacterium]
MNFKTKQLLLLFVVAIVALVSLTGIGFYRMHLLSTASLASQKKSLLDDYDALIKSQVETAISILASIEVRTVTGELSVDDAKKLGAGLVRNLRFQKDGYFWIDTVDGTNIVLLGKPSEGKNRIDLQDKNGKYFIREIITQGRKNGGGYTDYWFPKAGSDIPLSKRSYSLEFKPWHWIVGTGNYIDDIDKVISERHKASHREFVANIGFFAGSTAIIVLIFIGTGFLTYLLMRNKNREIESADKKIADLVDRFSLAADAARIGVWDWSVVENRLVWDKWMFALYGVEEKDPSKAYAVWKRGVHPDDRERGNVAIAQALHGEKDFEGEFRVVWPGGEIRHLRVSALVLRDADGRPLRMIGVNYDVSELKQAQEAIQRQEKFLRATIDGLSVHTCVVNKDGIIVVTNRAWNSFAEENGAREGTYGEGASYLGACCAPHEDGGADIEEFATAIKGVINGSLTDFVKEYPCHSPVAQRWFICRINPFTVSGSTYAVISHENITERKLAEIEQQRLYEELHSILKHTDQGIYGIDESGRFTFINRAGLQILGYQDTELVGKDSHRTIHHSYGDGSPYPALECPIYRANAARTSSRSDNELLWRKDGSSFAAELSSYPVIEHEIFHGGVVTFSDVTERRLAEETRRKLTRAIEQCPVSIVITDTNGVIEFVNPRFTELTGYTSEEAIGQNQRVLKSGETPPEVFASLWTTIAAGKTWEGDFVNKSKDGTLFWEHAVISPLLDESGGITHYLAVKEDITEKRKIQAELISARDKAEAATLAKSQFLATMSHEIRTPMNGVIGMSNLLLETDLSEEQRQYAEIVNKSGENLLGLINDILDFSKIEAGKLDMEIIDFDIRTTMEDTAEMLAMRASQAGLELICHIDPAVPEYLKGDPGRLRQIITNLAGNSIKFTSQGEIGISAAVASEDNGFVVIRFEITDTGIGIPENRRAALFTPFTQVDGSTTRKYGGTGLGLAICKQLTELMGGEIGIESEEGKGSTFWFTARFEKQSEVSIVPEVLADITGTKILVVDDNAANRMLLTTLLNHWGCRHDSAVDGDSAVALLRSAVEANDPFRVALLDQEMPGMDGSELGRRIKADPHLAPTQMIMVTSLAQRGEAAALQQIGFAGYLPKPVRQKQLHECIALVLGRGGKTLKGLVTQHSAAELAVRDGTPLRDTRILLAEDNIINQKVAQSILGKLGYKADVVANGYEAVRALEMIDYDIVLMDCQMPEMDGYEATAMIRDAASKVLNHKVPIIAMTANAMKGERDLCIEAGMDDYLPKPVKKDELAAMLGKWG